MPSAELIGVIAVVILEHVVGTALNMYILLVYIGNQKNGLSLGPSDMIHFTKALVNVSAQLAMILLNILYVWPHLFSINEISLFFIIITLFMIFYNFWLTALLCVYYCTNITGCGHRRLAWLKRILSSYLLHILLVSGLGSLVPHFPIIWLLRTESAGNSTHHSTGAQRTFLLLIAHRTLSTTLGCILPFSIAFISITLTSWTLISHIWRMKQNNTGSKLQTQINATRTMVLFLLSSVTYNVVIIFHYNVTYNLSVAEARIIWFVIISYPILEAIIIIQSSFKFRKALAGKFFIRASSNQETET